MIKITDKQVEQLRGLFWTIEGSQSEFTSSQKVTLERFVTTITKQTQLDARNKALDEVLADVENIIKEEYLEKSGLARFKWLKTKIEKLKGIYE